MNTYQKLTACGLALLLLASTATPSWSQRPRPGGGQPARPQKPPAAPKKPPAPPVHHDPPASQPAPRPATPPPAAKPAETELQPPSPALETNPAVRAVLESPRKEPRDFVSAILLLIDLGRPELAKPMMAELMKLNVSDEQRIAIVDEFGSQGMLHLARAKELAPDGAAFSDACMAAANAAANSPQRIATLVQQLADASAENRTIARNDLAAAGQVGATAALEALSHETDPQRRAALLSAIELLHPLVNAPLVAMLETNDAQLRADVVTLLQRLAVPQAAPLLAANSASAERSLATAIYNYNHGTPPFATDESNQVEFWKWDDAAKKLSSTRLPADEAQVAWISRLADELARTRPDNPADQLQALVLRLETTGLVGSAAGTGKRINPASLAQADPHALSAALAIALKTNYSHAALALVEALGKTGDPNVLLTGDGKPSPLAAALDSPNRRVRFAALQAIMALNPAAPYAGSSRVPEALEWFANGTGVRQAVVAMPTLAVASDLAGQLATHQIAAEATNRGRNAVDVARDMPGLELILVDMNILIPDVRETVYELRINPTTGDVPIALLAAEGRLDAAKRLAAEHTRVIAVPRPHSPEALASIVEDLAKLAARYEVPDDERTAEAEQAQKWLTTLSSGNRPFYTFRRTAMRTPATAATPTPPSPPPPAEEPAAEALPAP